MRYYENYSIKYVKNKLEKVVIKNICNLTFFRIIAKQPNLTSLILLFIAMTYYGAF